MKRQRLSSTLRTIGMTRVAPVDPVEHIGQLRRRDTEHAIDRRRPDEAALLQPFGVEQHAETLKIPLISDEAINIGKSWLFEEELTELFHERPQAILPHGRDELIMQAALAEQRMDTSLGCAGL